MSPDRPSGRRAELPFLPGVEGLRGVAVAAVLLFHAKLEFAGGGFLGVSTFFTLSGFLITALLLAESEANGRISLGAFYARRVRRILPAAVVALGVIVAFGAFAADVSQLSRLRGDVLSALLYCANWWLMISGGEYASQIGSPSPVQHFWSLAIEEQFYFFYPLFVLILLGTFRASRRGFATLLGIAVAASWLWGAWLEADLASHSRLYYGTDTRCAEIFIGALLGAWWRFDRAPSSGRFKTAIEIGGILGLGVSAFFWMTSSPHDLSLFRGGLAIYSVATVALLASVLIPTGPVATILSLSPLRWLGRVSYGAYLYHWPLFLWMTPESTGWGTFTLTIARIGTTLLVSDVSYRLIEQPIRTRAWPSGRGIVVLPAASIAALLSGALLVTSGVPDPWPEFDFRMDATERSNDPDILRVAVFGDSVAVEIGTGLADWGERTGSAKVLARARLGCGVARGGRTDDNAEALARACDNWDKRWGATLDEFRPDVVLLLSTGWDLKARILDDGRRHLIGEPVFDAWLRSEFDAAAERLTSQGSVLGLLSSPCVLPGPYGAKGVFDPKRTRALNDGILHPLADAMGERVEVIDLFSHVCPDGKYTNSLGGVENLRPDGRHFSRAGARWLAEWLGPQVVALAERNGR